MSQPGRGSFGILASGGRHLPLLLSLALAACSHSAPVPEAPAEPARVTAASKASPWCAADVHGTAEASFGVKGPLFELNREFLEADARARAQQCAALESKRLVLRYAFGLFEARYLGKEVLHTFVVPAAYHPVKDVSHAVFLAALLFAEPPGTARDQQVVRTLDTLQQVLAQLQDASSPTATLLPKPLYEREARLLDRTQKALARFSRGELGPDGQRAYFQSVRGDVEDNLRDIATQSLKALHAAVETTRREVFRVNPNAWDSVVVVVAVAHQARAREIGIQYFERLLHEPVGEGARNERRMVVTEQVWQAPEQYGLLAAHLVDQAAGAAIFDDPLRMQWDVLGDDGAALDAVLPR